MSGPVNDGGPAFPLGSSEHVDGVHYGEAGMTLRDYFAAKVMGEASALELEYPTGPNGDASYHGAATRAYLMADAMLKAREVQP